MFSSRTPGSLEANRLSVALAARRARGLSVLDLTLTNPTRAGLDYPVEEILAALQDRGSVAYEPTAQGLLVAREAVAAHHAAQGYSVSPEHVFLTSSTSEAYGWLFKLLCEPGDEVLVPRPSYPLFDCLAALDAVRCAQYPLLMEPGWPVDFHALEQSITPRTRAILFVNPNNPTGSYLQGAEFERLAALAARHGIALISDEVFFDFAWGADPGRISALAPHKDALVFTLSGLSKAAGLPQMKLGWIHVGGPEALRSQAIERLEWIADAYLPVSAPVQYAAARWLGVAPGVRTVIMNQCRAALQAAMEELPPESGCRVLPPQGGWSAVMEVPKVHSEEEWVLGLLEECGVLVQPGYFYDFEREAFLVVSLLAAPEAVRHGVREIRNGVGRTLNVRPSF